MDPEWYEEMAGIDPPRLLAVAKVTPEQRELVDFDGNPLTPEKVEYARAFTRVADAYYATGDMTGFQGNWESPRPHQMRDGD